jgi:hypothetical protein
MIRFRTVEIAAAAAVCVALNPAAAFAGGEPKNVAPFTRPAGTPTPSRLAAPLRRSHRPTAGPATGERKNGPPFNAVVHIRNQTRMMTRAGQRLGATCLRSPARTSACHLVDRYFAAVSAGRVREACSLLGKSLWLESGGARCPRVLATWRGTPTRIVRARSAASAVDVFVYVGFRELDHTRMLGWIASVGHEDGRLRILDTRRSG